MLLVFVLEHVNETYQIQYFRDTCIFWQHVARILKSKTRVIRYYSCFKQNKTCFCIKHVCKQNVRHASCCHRNMYQNALF